MIQILGLAVPKSLLSECLDFGILYVILHQGQASWDSWVNLEFDSMLITC